MLGNISTGQEGAFKFLSFLRNVIVSWPRNQRKVVSILFRFRNTKNLCNFYIAFVSFEFILYFSNEQEV